MKTFASALLASSVLGTAAFVDFSMEGSYYMTRDATVIYGIKATSSDTGTGADSTIAAAALGTGQKYGSLKYTFAVTSDFTAKQFTSVCTMYINALTMSSGAAVVDSAWEMFTCYKDGRGVNNDRRGLSCWAVGFHHPVNDTAKTYKITVYNYQQTSITDEIAQGVTVYNPNDTSDPNNTGASGIEATANGFAKSSASKWTLKAKYARDDTLVGNTPGTTQVMTTDQSASASLKLTQATAGTTEMTTVKSTVTIAEKATTISAVTSVFTWKAQADTNFQTNGTVFQGVMRNFTQTTTPLMYFGFKWSLTTTTGHNFHNYRNLTLNAASMALSERWTQKDQSTTEATTVWSTTVGKPTGVATAQSKLDLFAWDDLSTEGGITVRVQQTTVLSAEVTTNATDAQVQQMTCLNFFTSSSAILQYLCFLSYTNIAGAGTSEDGTSTMKQTVWQAAVTPAIAMYSASGSTGANVKAFDDSAGATNLFKSTQKAFVVYEGETAAAIAYGQEAKWSDTMPNAKFIHMHGNYVGKDRKTVVTTFGFNANVIANAAGANAKVNLTAGNLKTIKDSCASAGFAGTALSLNGAAYVSTMSATAAFATTDPNATTCTTMTEATCKSTYTLVKSGALSTIASVGAAIAALAMSF